MQRHRAKTLVQKHSLSYITDSVFDLHLYFCLSFNLHLACCYAFPFEALSKHPAPLPFFLLPKQRHRWMKSVLAHWHGHCCRVIFHQMSTNHSGKWVSLVGFVLPQTSCVQSVISQDGSTIRQRRCHLCHGKQAAPVLACGKGSRC